MSEPTPVATPADDERPPFAEPLYPQPYVWFVFASALDVLLTFIVLYFGGREVNKVAAWVIEEAGIVGMTLFKFALVVFVILLCQVVGRLDRAKGRRLAEWAVAITFIPVTFTFVMLLADRFL
jgi:hypothetical protein